MEKDYKFTSVHVCMHFYVLTLSELLNPTRGQAHFTVCLFQPKVTVIALSSCRTQLIIKQFVSVGWADKPLLWDLTQTDTQIHHRPWIQYAAHRMNPVNVKTRKVQESVKLDCYVS